jgi:hypothetical protein
MSCKNKTIFAFGRTVRVRVQRERKRERHKIIMAKSGNGAGENASKKVTES